MHQHLCVSLREKRADSGYVLKMVKTYLSYILNMWNKIKLRVKNDTQVLNRLRRFKFQTFNPKFFIIPFASTFDFMLSSSVIQKYKNEKFSLRKFDYIKINVNYIDLRFTCYCLLAYD